MCIIFLFAASVLNDALRRPRLAGRLTWIDGKTTTHFTRPRCGIGRKIEFEPTYKFPTFNLVNYLVVIQDTLRHFIANSDTRIGDHQYIFETQEPAEVQFFVCPCGMTKDIHQLFLKNGFCTLIHNE